MWTTIIIISSIIGLIFVGLIIFFTVKTATRSSDEKIVGMGLRRNDGVKTLEVYKILDDNNDESNFINFRSDSKYETYQDYLQQQ